MIKLNNKEITKHELDAYLSHTSFEEIKNLTIENEEIYDKEHPFIVAFFEYAKTSKRAKFINHMDIDDSSAPFHPHFQPTITITNPTESHE